MTASFDFGREPTWAVNLLGEQVDSIIWATVARDVDRGVWEAVVAFDRTANPVGEAGQVESTR